MSSATANATDDVGGKVLLLGAVVLTMTDATTIFADLVLVVAESTIEGCELAKLVALVIILAFGSRRGLETQDRSVKFNGEAKKRIAYRLNNLIDHFHTSSDLLLRFSEDQAMEVLLSIIGKLVRASLALLYTALATNADLGPTVPLHLLQTVTTRSDQQTEEIDFGEFLDGNVDPLRRTLGTLLLMVLDGRTEIGIVLHGTVDQSDALVLEFLAVADLTGVGPATVGIIGWGRRG